MPHDSIRQPVPPRRPPAIPSAAPAGTLPYATPPRPRKSWPRRAWNHVRYHYEDRLGNAIMFGVTVLAMMFLILLIRPWWGYAILREFGLL